MIEQEKPKGIFSDKHLPREWVSQKPDTQIYLPAISKVCPGMRVVSQLARSSNTTTFVLRGDNGLQVCQFAKLSLNTDQKIAPFEEKYNPHKFDQAVEKMRYLQSKDVLVPTIISNGNVEIGGALRQYLVMDFVKGVSADVFMSHHPNKTQEVYYKFGEILGRLSQVPFEESDISPDELVLAKVEHASNFLSMREIIEPNEANRLVRIVKERLSRLGTQHMTYVHLDPFPTNLHISGKHSNFQVTLMDIEAIQAGHQIIEGLGRAIQWGIYDWNYISGSKIEDIDSILGAFLDGYSQTSNYAFQIRYSSSELEWLMNTSQLVHLPQAMMYETRKDHPIFEPGTEYSQETLDWNRTRLSQLLNVDLNNV